MKTSILQKINQILSTLQFTAYSPLIEQLTGVYGLQIYRDLIQELLTPHFSLIAEA